MLFVCLQSSSSILDREVIEGHEFKYPMAFDLAALLMECLIAYIISVLACTLKYIVQNYVLRLSWI